jgi:hypothetical protein
VNHSTVSYTCIVAKANRRLGRRALVRKKAVENVVEQVVDINPIVLVVQTQSGRNVVKTVPFEAGNY